MFGQRLQLTLLLLLGRLGDADLVVLRHGEGDARGFAQDGDLEQARVDGVGEVGDLLEQLVGLPDLVGRLLEPALGPVDPPVAVVDVAADVPHVVVVEAELRLLAGLLAFVFGFERFAVHLRAEPEVLLRVGEEVVRAGADQVGAADFGVGEGELGVAGGLAGAHELLYLKNQVSILGGIFF